MNNIQIQKENVLKAYKNANDEQKEMLEHLFGSEVFKPLDVKERIKSFEDAKKELGENHPFVMAWTSLHHDVRASVGYEQLKDIDAYLKLRIITAALNEGWEPKFEPGEYRWAPYFLLYTKDEIAEMNEETKARVVLRSNSFAYANGGVSFAFANYDSACVYASCGSRLAFKSEELAEYAGKQFIDIYANFIFNS